MKRVLSLALVWLSVVSCGGGGSTSSSPSTSTGSSSTPVGIYTGNTNLYYGPVYLELIVLPNHTVYGIYGVKDTSGFTAQGLILGYATYGNGTAFTISNFTYWYAHDPLNSNLPGSLSGNFAGTYASGKISGTFDMYGKSGAFDGVPVSSSQISFNSTGSLASVAGTWNGSSALSGISSVVMQSDGTYSGSIGGIGISIPLSNCTYSGKLTPDSSNNYYSVSVTFSGMACALGGQTVPGIALLENDPTTGRPRLTIAYGISAFGEVIFVEK